MSGLIPRTDSPPKNPKNPEILMTSITRPIIVRCIHIWQNAPEEPVRLLYVIVVKDPDRGLVTFPTRVESMHETSVGDAQQIVSMRNPDHGIVTNFSEQKRAENSAMWHALAHFESPREMSAACVAFMRTYGLSSLTSLIEQKRRESVQGLEKLRGIVRLFNVDTALITEEMSDEALVQLLRSQGLTSQASETCINLANSIRAARMDLRKYTLFLAVMELWNEGDALGIPSLYEGYDKYTPVGVPEVGTVLAHLPTGGTLKDLDNAIEFTIEWASSILPNESPPHVREHHYSHGPIFICRYDDGVHRFVLEGRDSEIVMKTRGQFRAICAGYDLPLPS